ncbi:MAG: glutamine--fructose-6-phosphate transaminase (isomerizing) [Betaproteobacteria bacterium TMED82]|nr:MAG: glutamine--fructose-6-phosphate transaminase (isomerizing) [Betaproteobacteria bacterium TMED82]|tara:strand:+ start:46106 stop:47950 length:1845 start_codon:yes stop_codon:yes gene_type:complete
MCGIFAGVNENNIIPKIISGLKKLEYRGYDSSGIAWIKSNIVKRDRSVGRVKELEKLLGAVSSNIAIGHTRWATHGEVNKKNAHPHMSKTKDLSVCIVHNGIVENYLDLKKDLLKEGYKFHSDTDTEVVAHQLHFERRIAASLPIAINALSKKLIGAYALVALSDLDSNTICGIKKGVPLIVGGPDIFNGNFFLSSDLSGLITYCKKVVFLDDEEIVEISLNEAKFFNSRGIRFRKRTNKLSVKQNESNLGPYTHFMQKEIHEQPGAVAATLETIVSANSLTPNLFGPYAAKYFEKVNSVTVVACGTSYHAGLVAKYWIEEIAGLPVSVEIASEFRYRKSVILPDTLFVAVSQSGETADTLAAVYLAKTLKLSRTLAICNVSESTLIRECKMFFLTRAGQEIGVASTKAFTTQLAALFVLTLVLAKSKNLLDGNKERNFLNELRHLPSALAAIIAAEKDFKKWTKFFKKKKNVLFLGRGIHSPIAMEGALKLKEISYIHAEAYAAGELKHGPLALIDKEMPIIAVAPNDELVNKLKNNLEEVRARGGKLFVIADLGSGIDENKNIKVITLGDHVGHLSPILHVIPLQILAYHIAVSRGNDVDQPRNLAKSVTVE